MTLYRAFTLESWRRSIASLAFQLTQLSHVNNLFGTAGTESGKFLFSDSGVPLPRPCTILAWASLCTVNSLRNRVDLKTHCHYSPDIFRSPFILPFLPKIRHGEDTNQSLVRSSRHHSKNSLGDIRWGKIYLADSFDGTLKEEFSHGAYSVSHLSTHERASTRLATPFPIPPLWAAHGSGWEFGMHQPFESVTFTLRDPMIELAKHGIPERTASPNAPLVRSILTRFLEVSSAAIWARAYSRSLHAIINDPDSITTDFQGLIADIRTARLHEKEASDKKTKTESALSLAISSEEMLNIKDLMSQLQGKD